MTDYEQVARTTKVRAIVDRFQDRNGEQLELIADLMEQTLDDDNYWRIVADLSAVTPCSNETRCQVVLEMRRRIAPAIPQPADPFEGLPR